MYHAGVYRVYIQPLAWLTALLSFLTEKAYLEQETRYQKLYTSIMSSSIKNLAFLALATGLASVASAQSESGSGTTTRYWYG